MVEFEDVSVEYPGGVLALSEVNLTIQRGEFVFLLGQTGSGKSTLLKLLIRELKPTRGRVMIQGRDLSTIPEKSVPFFRRKIGFVPQDIGLLPNKKVWENLAYAMRAAGHSRYEVRKRVPEFLERLNLLHRSSAFPRALSGGEQQRVAIARALINNPVLLLADEPTGHLDPETSRGILAVLEDINTRGTTVLMATHDLPIVQQSAKRVIRLERGTVVSDTIGLPEEADA
ncbi:MAG: ATP-binding cassette domain-containing protein [Armatimonadetes bacterium]|nr:MAG: ATP-binding cassette domain-containing protein [Armatimonadota bacterium]GIV02765.1 MAG: cell division ATP-binding protein FtsE [Fimbriimonadales bacterium]